MLSHESSRVQFLINRQCEAPAPGQAEVKDLLGSFDLPLAQTSHCLLCGLQDLLQTVHLYSQVCWNHCVHMCPAFVWVRIDEESEIRLVIMATSHAKSSQKPP